MGMSPRRAVLALYLLASLFALAGYLSLARNSLPLAGLLLILGVGSVAIVKFAFSSAPRSQPMPRPRRMSEGPSRGLVEDAPIAYYFGFAEGVSV
jgi:hypothetical protein